IGSNDTWSFLHRSGMLRGVLLHCQNGAGGVGATLRISREDSSFRIVPVRDEADPHLLFFSSERLLSLWSRSAHSHDKAVPFFLREVRASRHQLMVPAWSDDIPSALDAADIVAGILALSPIWPPTETGSETAGASLRWFMWDRHCAKRTTTYPLSAK